MTDYSNLLSITQAARNHLGGQVTAHSIRRWIAKGVGVPPVKLPATRLGSQYFVDRRDLDEFIEALSDDPSRFARKRATERNEKAKRNLRKAGA